MLTPTKGSLRLSFTSQQVPAIPSHYRDEGFEVQLVLSGDFINAGEALGPGSSVTHPRGVVMVPTSLERAVALRPCRTLTLILFESPEMQSQMTEMGAERASR